MATFADNTATTNVAKTVSLTWSGRKLRVVNRSGTFAEFLSFTVAPFSGAPPVTAVSGADDTYIVMGGQTVELDIPGAVKVSIVASVASINTSVCKVP